MAGISLGRVTVLLLVARAAVYLLGLVNSIIVVRALGPELFGGYAYAVGVAALFGLLPNMGISTVVTRTIARDPDGAPGLMGAALRAQGLMAGVVAVGVPAFAAVLPVQPVPLAWVALAGAQLAVGALSWPYLAVLGGRGRFDRVAVAELLSGLAGTACLVAALALGASVVAFLWANVAAALVATAIARSVAAPLLPAGEARPVPLARLVREALPFGVTTAVQGLYVRLDVILLGQLASRVAVGLYGAAYKPITLTTFFGATVAGTLLPLMAQPPATGTPPGFDRAVRGLGVVGPALALALTGLGGPILVLLYGADFAAAAPILAVLAWSVTANWLYAPLGIALQARGRERWWLGSLAVGVALNAIGNVVAIPRWGALGAAAATLLSEIVLVMAGVLGGRALGLRVVSRPLAAALGAAAVGGGLLWGLAPLGPLVATGAALGGYAVVVLVLRAVTPADVGAVVGWVREAALGPSRG